VKATLVRAALDETLRSFRDASKAQQPSSHPWLAVTSGGYSDCNAHNEGLFCCLDPEHEAYEEMLTTISVRLAIALEKLR